jgi:hypothetical protein
MGLFCRSAAEATIGHLDIALISKKEETAAGQGKRQGNAWTVCRLIWNWSLGIHPRRGDCKQAPLQADPSHNTAPALRSVLVQEELRPELWLLLHDTDSAHRSVLFQEELRPELWLLLHDTALALRSVLVQEELHPELWRRKNWLLLHDTAPAHSSIHAVSY